MNAAATLCIPEFASCAVLNTNVAVTVVSHPIEVAPRIARDVSCATTLKCECRGYIALCKLHNMWQALQGSHTALEFHVLLRSTA